MLSRLTHVVVESPCHSALELDIGVASHSEQSSSKWFQGSGEVASIVGDAIGAVVVDANRVGIGVEAGGSWWTSLVPF